MRPNRRWLLGLKLVVSGALVAWVLYAALSREGVDALVGRIGDLDPAWIFGAVALQLAVIGTGVARWRVLLEAQGLRLPIPWLTRHFLIGRFVGAFTPSTAGLDFYRGVAVARRTGRRGDSTSVILVEKCVGLLGLAGACVLAIPLGGRALFGDSAMVGAGLVASGAALGLYLLARPRHLGRIGGMLPGRLGARVEEIVPALSARGLGVARVAGTVALSAAGHVLTAAVFVATGAALGVATGGTELLMVGLAIVVATLLPISIGGVGVREGVAVALLATVGVGAGEAALVALLGYLTGQVPALVGGLATLDPKVPTLPTPEPADG